MNMFARFQSRRADSADRQTVEILAPLSGLVVRLSDAPDEAFASGMLGEGIAVDPVSSVLCAPCGGEVVSIAEARHAATIRVANGAEILLHIGVETVALGGEGFKVLVRAGARVKAGDPLIEFDMDGTARKAKSLVSPVIVINGDDFVVRRCTEKKEAATGDFLMEIARQSEETMPEEVAGGGEAGGTAIVRLAHGVHARPAAEIVARAKEYSASVEISMGARRATARSVSSLMGLGAKYGDEVLIVARGRDASAAVAEIKSCLAAGSTELDARTPVKPATASNESKEAAPAPIAGAATFSGVMASPGVAIGTAHVLAAPETAIEEAGKGVEEEQVRFEQALDAVRTHIAASITNGSSPHGDILQTHVDLLDDPELVDTAAARIVSGKSAAFAWRSVMREQASMLRAMDDARMAERAADFVDLERQVLAALHGEETNENELPASAVLIADEIFPSQLLRLDREQLAGICMARGGPTSHASILAASKGIPTLVAVGPAVLGAKSGSTIIIDADRGEMSISPSEEVVATTRAKLERRRELRARALETGESVCRTADGARIEILANLASPAEAEIAVRNYAEGCGLLRTEFLFLDRNDPPSENEQAAEYQAIADSLGARPLVVRTLDVGADKAVPYLQFEKEDNPALGLRGVRASLARPELLETQLRAILRVRPKGRCRIMAPMVASLGELRAVRAMLGRIREALDYRDPAPLGVMVETPAAAILADQIAAEADFLSIGTNDLAQYVLAMDRGNAGLAAEIDALNPAVLRLIRMTGEAGARHGKRVSVCGGLASDFTAAPLLIGLGVGALSGSAPRIPELKAFIRTLRKDECEAAAREALDLKDASAVRAFARETWPQLAEWT